MKEENILASLIDWNLWGNFDDVLKERENQPELPAVSFALVIKGIRRSGKSMLSYLIAEKKFDAKSSLFINFEDPRLGKLTSEDILKIVEIYQKKVSDGNLPSLLVLDEVQNIKGWERVVRLYSEAKKINVIVTGSSSKLMSEEYSTVLTGRHIDFELFPLSFREVLAWNGINIDELSVFKNKGKVLSLFDKYMKFGSFPAIVKEDLEKEKIRILREYYRDILYKDIVKRFGIREIDKLEELARIYLSNISTLQSFNKLKNILRISLDSVERFSKYFEIARLFHFIRKLDISLRRQIMAPRKVYSADIGFYNCLGFKFSENIGRLMENLVTIELFRRKSYWHGNWEIFYWRDYQQKEVDFVVKEGLDIKQLIQVTYASGKDEIEKRELKAMVKASDLLRCRNLLVITWDYEDELEFKERKITFKPLWKWLLKS